MRWTRRQAILVVVAAALVGLLFGARLDAQRRESARGEFETLARQLTFAGWDAEQRELSWLALYPRVESAKVQLGSKVLARYQASAPTLAGELYRVERRENGVEVILEGRLPGWPTLSTEWPLWLLAWLAWVVAVRSWSPPTPSRSGELTAVASDGEDDGGEDTGYLVFELDADLSIQRVCRGIERLGYTAEELQGRPLSQVVERLSPNPDTGPARIASRRGARLDSVLSSSPVQNAQGALEKVVVTLAPVSGSDHGRLRRRYERMRQLCESICDHAREAIVIVDRSATVVYANASFQRALAGPCDGLALLSRLPAEHRLAFVDALQVAMDGGVSGPLELTLGEPSQAVLEGAFHTLRSTAESGSQPLAVGIFRDVAEARRLTKELELARQRAGHSQKIEALGRMAGGVAHDFNNLLATIVIHLEAAKAHLGQSDPVLLNHLEEMALAVSKASSVTRQLLLYSRKKPAEPRLVSCHQTVQDTLRLTKGLRGSMTVHLELDAEVDHVWLDDGQLDQVLLNLVVNAKDACGPGGRLSIRTANQDGAILLTVADNGRGIPPDLQTKVFEPYFTTKEVGKGTGLGLSTALAIIEKAGGRLSLESSEAGTCFEILLPLARGGREAPAPPSQPEARAAGSGRILLVEDEGAIRELLHRLLSQQGYLVTAAADGQQASSLLEEADGFDLLVTDLVLPGLTGPELARRFRQRCPGSPIIYMSGYPGDTLDGAELGERTRFLAKPFSHHQLMQYLEELLGVVAA